MVNDQVKNMTVLSFRKLKQTMKSSKFHLVTTLILLAIILQTNFNTNPKCYQVR